MMSRSPRVWSPDVIDLTQLEDEAVDRRDDRPTDRSGSTYEDAGVVAVMELDNVASNTAKLSSGTTGDDTKTSTTTTLTLTTERVVTAGWQPVAPAWVAATAPPVSTKRSVPWSVLERCSVAFGTPSGDVREHHLRPLAEADQNRPARRPGHLSPPVVMPAPGTRLPAPSEFLKQSGNTDAVSPPHKRQSTPMNRKC